MRTAPITSTCTTCGGGVAYQRNLADGSPKGPWLHLYEEDWIGSPHNVTPAESAPTISRPAVAVASEVRRRRVRRPVVSTALAASLDRRSVLALPIGRVHALRPADERTLCGVPTGLANDVPGLVEFVGRDRGGLEACRRCLPIWRRLVGLECPVSDPEITSDNRTYRDIMGLMGGAAS